MLSLNHFLRKKLSDREESGLLRALTKDRRAIDFFSNDYLGLSRSTELFDAIENLNRTLGVSNGSTGSRLLGGNTDFTEQVEEGLSIRFKSESSLIFHSGYAANLAVLSSVPQKGDTILYDQLAHASLKDGARLSLASRYSFRHNDLADLEQKLKVAKGNKFIVVESVYSMDGDQCPLREVTELAAAYDASIVLDEAHATGVMGPAGGGYSVSENLHDKIAIRIYTFGKAMGVHGACVSGSNDLIRYLINFARPFIYTTAPSQHQVASIHCAFTFLAAHPHLQHDLQKKIELYLNAMRTFSHRTPSHSAIQTILRPGNENVRNLAAALQERGFDVRPILSPTVPAGAERLRICLHTFNSDDEIVALTETLKKWALDTGIGD